MQFNKYMCRGLCIDEESPAFGKWVIGYYYHHLPRTGIFGQAITKADFEYDAILDPHPNHQSYEIDPQSLGRITGEYDKAGKPIFEWDILSDGDIEFIAVWRDHGWHLEADVVKEDTPSEEIWTPFKECALNLIYSVVDNFYDRHQIHKLQQMGEDE